MPRTPPPPPPPLPPRGVPRWLFPPPGATVRVVRITERVDAEGASTFEAALSELGSSESASSGSDSHQSGELIERLHLNALKWLLDEHERGELPACPFEGEITVAIAHTELAGGRVGHAYALNDGPLGEPKGDQARGVLWRFVHARLGHAE